MKAHPPHHYVRAWEGWQGGLNLWFTDTTFPWRMAPLIVLETRMKKKGQHLLDKFLSGLKAGWAPGDTHAIRYLFTWLHWVLAIACEFLHCLAAHRIFSCTMWTLSGSMWDLVPWPGIEPGSPALGAWSLSHWTTRKVPLHDIFTRINWANIFKAFRIVPIT